MAKGTRIELFGMGAHFQEGWSLEEEKETVEATVLEPQKHQLVFLYEKRNGKPVTIVKPFYLDKNKMQETLKSVKKKLGIGGTVVGEMLEFQGDKKEAIQTTLEALGFRFKKR